MESDLSAFLLDLDGTLIAFEPGILSSCRAALRSLGHEPIRPWMLPRSSARRSKTSCASLDCECGAEAACGTHEHTGERRKVEPPKRVCGRVQRCCGRFQMMANHRCRLARRLRMPARIVLPCLSELFHSCFASFCRSDEVASLYGNEHLNQSADLGQKRHC